MKASKTIKIISGIVIVIVYLINATNVWSEVLLRGETRRGDEYRVETSDWDWDDNLYYYIGDEVATVSLHYSGLLAINLHGGPFNDVVFTFYVEWNAKIKEFEKFVPGYGGRKYIGDIPKNSVGDNIFHCIAKYFKVPPYK